MPIIIKVIYIYINAQNIQQGYHKVIVFRRNLSYFFINRFIKEIRIHEVPPFNRIQKWSKELAIEIEI